MKTRSGSYRDAAATVIDDGGGPPLCTVEFRLPRRAVADAQRRVLCLFSDGVTICRTPRCDVRPATRTRPLARARGSKATAHAIVERLLADVDAFACGNRARGDVTVLTLRWIGPAAT